MISGGPKMDFKRQKNEIRPPERCHLGQACSKTCYLAVLGESAVGFLEILDLRPTQNSILGCTPLCGGCLAAYRPTTKQASECMAHLAEMRATGHFKDPVRLVFVL